MTNNATIGYLAWLHLFPEPPVAPPCSLSPARHSYLLAVSYCHEFPCFKSFIQQLQCGDGHESVVVANSCLFCCTTLETSLQWTTHHHATCEVQGSCVK